MRHAFASGQKSKPVAQGNARGVPQRLAAPHGMSNHRVLQTKAHAAALAINKPGDAFEQEADRIAGQVMRMPHPAVPVAVAREPVAQRRATDEEVPETVPPIVHDVLRSPGQPLDAATRDFMEPRFGQDFAGVRVHTDTHAAEAASSIDARAFTSNRSIVFGAGAYAPQTEPGRRLIAHELTHVAQQQAGVHLKDGLGEAGDAYEWQADKVAWAVTERRPADPLLDAYPPAPTVDRAVGAMVQRQGIGHGSGGVPAVSTYVAGFSRKDIENRLRGGKGAASKKLKPGQFLKFLRMLEQLDKALQGNAKQSWGWIIYGMGDGKDSPATKATRDAKISGTIDFKAFMEVMGPILDVFPENTSYRDLHEALEKKDLNEIAELVFEAVKEAKEQEPELEDPVSAPEKDTSLTATPKNQGETVKAQPSKGVKKTSTTTASTGRHSCGCLDGVVMMSAMPENGDQFTPEGQTGTYTYADGTVREINVRVGKDGYLYCKVLKTTKKGSK